MKPMPLENGRFFNAIVVLGAALATVGCAGGNEATSEPATGGNSGNAGAPGQGSGGSLSINTSLGNDTAGTAAWTGW